MSTYMEHKAADAKVHTNSRMTTKQIEKELQGFIRVGTKAWKDYKPMNSLPIALALFTTTMSVQAQNIQAALGMIESGADRPEQCQADRLVGKQGEVSRYQIKPEVWRACSPSVWHAFNPQDPKVSWTVAGTILRERVLWFQKCTKRDPNPAELYALWNAPSTFASKGFNLKRMPRSIQKKCQRFANLVDTL